MSDVRLELPAEVLAEVNLPYEGARGTSLTTIAIQGVSVAANIATLATLQPNLTALVTAIRSWRLRNPEPSATLTVRGPGVNTHIDLPKNVSTARLLQALNDLFESDE